MAKSKKNKRKWYFLIAVIIFYFILFLVNKKYFIKSGTFFINILKTIIPSFIIVFILLIIINYFITSKHIVKYFKEKSIKKWFFVLIGSIISTGPPFIWYPLLKEAKEKGVSYGIIACFIYARSIKIHFLPIIVLYFGIRYTLILTTLIIIMAVVQGVLIDKIMKKE